ncbi:uncharacterized protein ACLA_039460 [Aspergillus clavatus NRRL 1]|uniref:Uncharacterized protein n=1 Tax=Aspergillus clavatus (strain ATCC 1007 / CBS 513.65 / DSM 816 / NCTC 3887 / NRRL 1 / QM 1276 / 107) TaxID=344612 RepID=A1CKQ7_ASPCL|nr:uncharacterized protein ACLA_039460 [Aspergillus clavatus NRRL 1]EAW09731.1 conserved hypothetical protein [Aspergillus clavatus NRRL 1]
MPTPERNTGRLSPSRRNYNYQQQQQQPQGSPFRQARNDSHSVRDSGVSYIPSPTSKYGAQTRRTFTRTNTLTGAFNTVSGYTTMADDEDIATSTPYTTGTPSPHRRRQRFDPLSPESNPPNELAESYRRIDEADSLIGRDTDDEYHIHKNWNKFSPAYPARDYGVFDQATDESPRRRLSDHVQDEERLRRAKTSRSPVLSPRVKTSTAEKLQRHENMDDPISSDEVFKPKLNVPSGWGSKAKHISNWLQRSAPFNEPESEVENPISPQRSTTTYDFDFHTSPARAKEPARATRDNRAPLSDAENKLPAQRDYKGIQGDPEHIANTPITVYKNSSFNMPTPSKRDSHGLLQKLARRASPEQRRDQAELRTPEAPKGGQHRIYDKTPVVTGAWIDTPMTERVSDRVVERPEDSTKNDMPFAAAQDVEFSMAQIYGESNTVSEQNKAARERERARERLRQQEQERELQRAQGRQRDREKARLEEQEKERIEREEKEKNEREREEQEKSTEREKPKVPLVKPDLPKSALEAVMQEHKADKGSLDVGDDTLESLQEMLKEESVEPKAGTDDDAAYEKSVIQKLERGQGEKDSGDSKVNKQLRSLEQDQENVQKEIKSVEDQMTQKISKEFLRPKPPQAQPKSKRVRTGKKCDSCGAAADGRIYVSIPLPLLWRRNPVSRRIHPTRLGWFLLLSLLWFITESKMCDYYCHPTVAPVCEGNCLRRDAPRYPFVIPTMLWRWSHLSAVLAPVATVGIAFLRLLAQLLGMWDGYVDEPPRTLNLSGEVRIYGTRMAQPPVIATSTPGFFARQWPAKEPKYTPEAVYTPETVPLSKVVEEEVPRGTWDDDSMDDDELL